MRISFSMRIQSAATRKALGSALMVSAASLASAQATEAARLWGPQTWIGLGMSGYFLDYGDRKVGGLSGTADVELFHGIGSEGEARWLELHQHQGAHPETYLAGGRYHWNAGLLQPYAKALVGVGYFSFPNHGGTGGYFVAVPGGEVDFRVSSRWALRADGEVQSWPRFPDGVMKSVGLTLGIRRRIF
jgi:hypothetical protein